MEKCNDDLFMTVFWMTAEKHMKNWSFNFHSQSIFHKTSLDFYQFSVVLDCIAFVVDT